MAGGIKAVSFDLWDTIVRDGSDEPKRAARALGTKRDDRRRLVHAALCRRGDIAYATVATAYDVADAAFNKVWQEHHVTWTLRERLGVLLAGLGRALPEAAFARLVAETEAMEIDVPPEPVAGIDEALAALHGRYRLCVVSDAIVSPGRVLRAILAHHGLARYFEACIFSDEIGAAKPDPRMFHAAAERLGVDPREMVHVGDREHNDVAGPHALGMRAVLFTAVRRADEAATRADAVCRSHAELAAAIERLAARAA